MSKIVQKINPSKAIDIIMIVKYLLILSTTDFNDLLF